jgi:pyruvate formate lyase activating enzyme
MSQFGFRWNGCSLVDCPFPAAIIYTKGCNFSCRYCYNIDLLDPEFQLNDLTDKEILNRIKNIEKINTRTGEKYLPIEWLIISGGEPFITDLSILKLFLNTAKLMGLKTGIYTNGTKPLFIQKLINELNYIHIDFKRFDYNFNVIASMKVSFDYLNENKLDYFIINTTILKSEHDIQHLLKMKKSLKKLFNGKEIPIILQENLKQEKFAWTITPFYNNNDKIKTLGNLSSINESFSDLEIKNIMDQLNQT